MQTISNIAIVGAGNAAHHFAKAFLQLNHVTVIIYSRSAEQGKLLAKSVGVRFKPLTDLTSTNHDLVLLAVADNAIATVSKLAPENALVVHCSGATSMHTIDSNNKGVFYPLQTMSKDKTVDFSNIPILIETDSAEHYTLLETLAKKLSSKVYPMSSEQRLKLHLAAVFACNFSNFMMVCAQSYLEKEQIPFEILHKLITETAEKAIQIGPNKSQTGPAVRGDENVLQLHEGLLENEPELLHLYQTISNLIKSQHGIV